MLEEKDQHLGGTALFCPFGRGVGFRRCELNIDIGGPGGPAPSPKCTNDFLPGGGAKYVPSTVGRPLPRETPPSLYHPSEQFFDPVSISVVAPISGLGGVWALDEVGARVVQSGQNRHRNPTARLPLTKTILFCKTTLCFLKKRFF